MKRCIILLLLLAGTLSAQRMFPWDTEKWINDRTGTGLTTLDSLYMPYGGRTLAGYGWKFGLVQVKDTLGRRLRAVSADFDSVAVGVLQSKMGAAITVNATDTLKGAAKITAVTMATTGLLTSAGGITTSGATNMVSTGYISAATDLYTGALVLAKSTTANVTKNNLVQMTCNVDNPCIVYSDSASGAARTRDSLVYNGASFAFTRPVQADSGRFNTVLCAKDTSLEVALFTRTCTRDTLAFMTGSDSLVAAYIVSPFYTRGTPTARNPYIAGVVGGKLIVDRPAADTATFDRYAVTRIQQR